MSTFQLQLETSLCQKLLGKNGSFWGSSHTLLLDDQSNFLTEIEFRERHNWSIAYPVHDDLHINELVDFRCLDEVLRSAWYSEGE